MAWAPTGNSLALAAVPVTVNDVKVGISKQDYRVRLVSRVVWMMEQESDPEEAVEALTAALESRDLWPGVPVQANSLWGRVDELLTDNPAWPDYLNLQVEFSDDDPMPVLPIPAAVRAVQETTLSEWMDLMLTG
jgi:hypothetical protein